MNRRQFIKTTAMTGAATMVLRGRAWPFDQTLRGVTKFLATLPGLGPAGANNFGNYIPVLSPNKTKFPGTDYYEMVARQYTQQIHPAIPPTTFLGFADANTRDSRYLGGFIIAKRGTPAKLNVANQLPASSILPVDATMLDPAGGGRTDLMVIHRHGSAVRWDMDGVPFSWFSNAANGGFVHGSSFINAGPTDGTAIYDYPNDLSARLLWYHDHTYGLTRINVYAGLVSVYLITDDAEAQLINEGILPRLGDISPLYAYGIPLVVQDKTFWDGGGHDPNYNLVVPAGASVGSLWYPHVYEGAASEDLPEMTLNPLDCGKTARWEQDPVVPIPGVSVVPEFFSDTILVNGAPYPTFAMPPRRLRFRLLNGSNARFYNLQLYVADGSPDGITLAPLPSGEVDNNGNPILAPTNRPGPAFIQIGNETGFLPEPAVFSTDGTNKNSNHVIGYKSTTNLDDPTNGNVNRYNLVMAPAERADLIIDFRGFEGRKLILYSDAPAPFPGGDIRNDYYTGRPDLSCIGGAPPNTPGEGPDTRVLMRFEIGSSGHIKELSFHETVTALKSALASTFAETQPSTDIEPDGPAKVKTLNEDTNDPYGRLRQTLGAPEITPYLATPVDFAHQGEVQRWQIFNLTADTHPMHFHLVNVAVRKREHWAFDSGGNPIAPLRAIPDTARPPDPNERGWKETVRVNPGEVITVDMKFDMPSGAPPSPRLLASYGITGAEYVWHCHILEHEEHDMMHALVVTD